MSRRSSRAFFGFSIVTLMGADFLLTGCGATPPGAPGAPGTQQIEDEFFIGSASPSQRLAVGGEIDLDGGGSIGLPRGSPSGVEVDLAEGSLKVEAGQGFEQWNPDVSLEGPVLKITLHADAQAPQYFILRLPASDETGRIFVAGYIDADTSDLDWAPVPGTYDPQTGLVTAAVGLGLLQPVEENGTAAQKGALRFQGTGPLTYTGHVGVGVGGRQFSAQISFIADEPTGSLEVPFEGPPIPVRGRLGARLSNITHQPLETLTVTSDFGPRPSPVPGASTNHQGVDYRAADRTIVNAAGDGTVVTSRCQNNSVNCGRTANGNITGGYIVEIDHGNGETTRYMHMTNPASVSVGDTVTGGQAIGLSDSTGGVAPHLHFEVKQNGTAVDPELFFNGDTITATIAMALDYEVQAGTEQQIPLTRREVITPEEMTEYVNIFELTGVEPGEHRLQFVIVEPSGTLEILAEVPLTVGEPFLGLTGAELHFTDTTRDDGNGNFQYVTERLESVFSLVAIDDSRLQGEAHITYFRLIEISRANTDFCPTSTDSYGPVEWDAVLEGTYGFVSDGSIAVGFTATPPSSPDYTYTQNHPGCPQFDSSSTESGIVWSHAGWNLVDGRYDYREDEDLQPGVSGEDYYEVHLRWTVP